VPEDRAKFGIVAPPEHADDDVEDSWLMAAHELLEGRRIARARALDEGLVGGMGALIFAEGVIRRRDLDDRRRRL
jgi:hypothetical protein